MLLNLKNITLGLTGICLFAISSFAQKENTHIRSGNDEFKDQNFAEAEIEYRKAIDINPASFKATFNMADALFKQKKYEEAIQNYKILINQESDKERLASVYHNLGNSYMQMQQVDAAIDAYKNALRNKPDDMDSKYNLAYAQDMKQKQQNQQQQQDQNQDQQQNQDQNKENKDDQQQNKNDKEQDKKDQEQNKNQEQQNKEQDQKDKNDQQQQDQQQQQQQQKDKISKEDAERILKALQNDEDKTQQKVREKQKAQAKKVRVEKDW